MGISRVNSRRLSVGSWEDDEPGLAQVVGHLRRLRRRASLSKLLVYALATLVALLCVAYRARGQRTYTAEIVFRVAEGNVDARTEPRPAKQLREYVNEVAFSRPKLIELIRKHELYTSMLARDQGLAVEELRSNLEVEVARNYFMVERGIDDPPRSALVSIEFRAADPVVAMDVAKDLSELVMEQERGLRRRMADAAAREAESAARELRVELNEKQRELTITQQALLVAKPEEAAELLVKTSHLRKDIDGLDLRLKTIDGERSALELRAGAEGGSLGLVFELVDMKTPRRPLLSWRDELILIGMVMFLTAFPLTAMAVGAFDRRIHGIDDVEALGMIPFGVIPLRAVGAGVKRKST